MARTYIISEICGDWALQIREPGHPHQFLYFNSENNADLVKSILEWEDAHPNEAVSYKPTLTPTNEPLTLEQLREMDGEPVWVVVSQNWRESGIKSGWRLVKFHINDDRIRLYMFDTHFGASFFAEQDMGRSYWVYRRPPGGKENHHG